MSGLQQHKRRKTAQLSGGSFERYVRELALLDLDQSEGTSSSAYPLSSKLAPLFADPGPGRYALMNAASAHFSLSLLGSVAPSRKYTKISFLRKKGSVCGGLYSKTRYPSTVCAARPAPSKLALSSASCRSHSPSVAKPGNSVGVDTCAVVVPLVALN